MSKNVFLYLLLLIGTNALGQTTSTQANPYFDFSKGLGITAPDSVFSMNIRFRMQSRVVFTTYDDEDLGIKQVEGLVRRMRLRFGGFIYDPRLTYNIQFSFTRGDMDWENTKVPNIVRDAFLQYQVNKKLWVGFGQTKLPGNRQRVVSSGDQQLVDRSVVNATFNIDRDFGVQFGYKEKYFLLRGAISTGEGRNIPSGNNGLAYTGRLELLPMGSFTNGGDYFEGDLMREKKGKLSIGLTVSHNHHAVRTAGQLGTDLYDDRNISSTIIDLLYKHNGWAFSSELHDRTSSNPITDDGNGKISYVYAGKGQLYQLSYLFKNNIELIGRYAEIKPSSKLETTTAKGVIDHTFGVTKYVKAHRVKIQTDLTYQENYAAATPDDKSKLWQYRFQIELGI